MELSMPSRVLFELIDQVVERRAESILSKVFSEYGDVPLTSERRKVLESIVREQLNELVQGVLGIFNNVGGVIPDTPEGIIGYRIRSLHFDERSGETSEGPSIATDFMDYADMWWEYLQDEREKRPT